MILLDASMCSVCSDFMMMCKGKNMFCLILEFTDNLDQWQFIKICIIWYDIWEASPKILGLWLGCCIFCMIWYMINDKCIIFCMIWYMRIQPQNFGIKAWLYDLIYMRNAAVYSWHFLLCLSQVPKLNLNHIKRISKLKQKLSNYVSFLQDMESLLLIASSIFSQFSSF